MQQPIVDEEQLLYNEITNMELKSKESDKSIKNLKAKIANFVENKLLNEGIQSLAELEFKKLYPKC